MNIYEDNQGSLDLITNPVFYAQTKHIQVYYYTIRDFVKAGEIEIAYTPMNKMLADRFIKPLDQVKFEQMIKGLGLTN